MASKVVMILSTVSDVETAQRLADALKVDWPIFFDPAFAFRPMSADAQEVA